jgi:S1-C subfamily serine protease
MTLSVLIDSMLIAGTLSYFGYGVIFKLTRSTVVGAAMVTALTLALELRYSAYETINDPDLRLRITFLTSFGSVLLGSVIGHFACKKLYSFKTKRKLYSSTTKRWRQISSRATGGIGLAVLIVITMGTMSHTVGQFGVPRVSQAVAGSITIQMLHDWQPRAVKVKFFGVLSLLSEKRATVLPEGFGGTNLEMVSYAGDRLAISPAAESVVRITGNAYACGQGRSGTGFAVAEDRIITNAHVVAGVTRPVIEAPNGQVLIGKVVYFDSDDDVAVVAVTGLDVNALNPGAGEQTGERVKIVAYPHGGPISSEAAKIQSDIHYLTKNIYSDGKSPRHIYTLSGDAKPGSSGAPVLNADGDYVGMVFARATHMTNVAYAMTLAAVRPAVNDARLLTEPVSSGECITG